MYVDGYLKLYPKGQRLLISKNCIYVICIEHKCWYISPGPACFSTYKCPFLELLKIDACYSHDQLTIFFKKNIKFEQNVVIAFWSRSALIQVLPFSICNKHCKDI